jgi:hypothetical protein
MRNLRPFGQFLLAFLGAFGIAGGQGTPTGTLQVQVFGPFGEKIPNAVLLLYTPDRRQDLAGARQGNRIAGIPYGRYILVGYAGREIGEREVVVNTKESSVRLGLAFPMGEGVGPAGNLTVSGDIKPPPGGGWEEWWVRVEGVFLNDSREAPIQSGHFSVAGLGIGEYSVQLFEGSKLRHVETIEIDTKEPNTRLTILLSGKDAPH